MVPNSTEPRQDIIQAVTLKKSGASIAFCKEFQAAAPVDSYVDPEPWDMPGYDRSGHWQLARLYGNSSVELSADGPVKRAICRIFPGGLTWEQQN